MIIETKKLEEARLYIGRMCESCDPLTAARATEPADTLNNADFLRTMYFVKSILDAIKAGELQSRDKTPFPEEILTDFTYTEDAGITNLLKKIYAPIAGSNVQKLSPQLVGIWMRDHGYIADEYSEKLGCDICIPTQKGQKIGLYYKTRDFQGRKFVQIYYSKPAQEFIVKNFHKIMEYHRCEDVNM